MLKCAIGYEGSLAIIVNEKSGDIGTNSMAPF